MARPRNGVEMRIVAAYAVLSVVAAVAAWLQLRALPGASAMAARGMIAGGSWLPVLYGLILPFTGRVSWETGEDRVRSVVSRAGFVALFGIVVVALTVSLMHPVGSPERMLSAVLTDPPSRAAFLALVAEFAGVYALVRLALSVWRGLRGEDAVPPGGDRRDDA